MLNADALSRTLGRTSGCLGNICGCTVPGDASHRRASSWNCGAAHSGALGDHIQRQCLSTAKRRQVAGLAFSEAVAAERYLRQVMMLELRSPCIKVRRVDKRERRAWLWYHQELWCNRRRTAELLNQHSARASGA